VPDFASSAGQLEKSVRRPIVFVALLHSPLPQSASRGLTLVTFADIKITVTARRSSSPRRRIAVDGARFDAGSIRVALEQIGAGWTHKEAATKPEYAVRRNF